MEIENINPNVYKKCEDRKRLAADLDENVLDPFDEREVFGESRNTYTCNCIQLLLRIR